MEKIDENIIKLMQNESLQIESVDVIGDGAGEFIPRTKKNIGYIVGGIVFNEKNEILMTQESKRSCYEKWYLPMGRMEPGETLQEGAIREVEEETGIISEPVTLLVIESGGSCWFRFLFIMKQTGGALKTKEDKESIKAEWFPPDKILNKQVAIRSTDIFPVIKRGVDFMKDEVINQPNILPVIVPHIQMIYRFLLISKTQDGDYGVLVNINKDVHLPCCMVGQADMSIMVSLFKLFKEVFGRVKEIPKVCGIINIEYCGKPANQHDGMCITCLISLKTLPKLEGSQRQFYDWHVITHTQLIEKLHLMLQCKAILPFTDVHAKGTFYDLVHYIIQEVNNNITQFCK
ncbi:hypothetical protein LOTGIDRAFT_232724 [Lottia gigantea]|uniref:Nudix hydrolase domain-containing protein n=1 Tax=Lottia gigantea TaxID=225164 RepID=V3ZPE5_LOTGI|nr:hypothetical protein LOTGIDRAFT_232724 [Lottia gigantea]ESO93283.1 hypothetical protein LOTGIDRAFT_232724 [Lottia gigantea]